ncbi:mucin-5AC [Salix suchowensis]|nr:mucin-5AC [Salix suchowensis]
METLVVAQHRNQYYSGVKPQRPAKFGSAPSKHFGISIAGLFIPGGVTSSPFQTSTTPATKSTTHAPPASHPPKTPPPAAKSHSVDIGRFKTASKSSPITINVKTPRKEISFNEMGFVNENLLFSELWAGPAYSNSPPPSSLPIPKFSMRPPKRTVSLDSPVSDYADFDVQPTVKSAPASPSREHSPCIRDMFLSADSATKTLRRILNLDVAEE